MFFVEAYPLHIIEVNLQQWPRPLDNLRLQNRGCCQSALHWFSFSSVERQRRCQAYQLLHVLVGVIVFYEISQKLDAQSCSGTSLSVPVFLERFGMLEVHIRSFEILRNIALLDSGNIESSFQRQNRASLKVAASLTTVAVVVRRHDVQTLA